MRERRQAPRYLCELKGQVRQLGSGVPLTVNVTTLSTKGCGIEGTGTLNVGQRCTVGLEWHGKDLRAEAEVVWATAQGRAGLKIVGITDENLALLKELCATLQLQPLVRLPPEPEEKGQA